MWGWILQLPLWRFDLIFVFEITIQNSFLECKCDPEGSSSIECSSNGQCTCNIGYTGEKCDICADTFFSQERGKCAGKE